MAKIGLPKGSGKRLKVREKSVKSQGILKWILSGNPVRSPKTGNCLVQITFTVQLQIFGGQFSRVNLLNGSCARNKIINVSIN